MCSFKSGIILKHRCYIAQGDDDSHTTLLDELNIADTRENAMTKFVRAELIPANNEWWADADDWKFKVDQDIVPDWFDIDRQKYETEFRNAVKEWCRDHVLVDQKIDTLSNGYYRLKRCEVKKLMQDVNVMCDSSTVSKMCDSSTVSKMCDSSTVSKMYDSSTVSEMYDSSTVSKMYDSSTVSEMCDSSIARDYAHNKIYISSESNLEVVKRS